jgi:membrane protein YqaA with SNARE-associated domain
MLLHPQWLLAASFWHWFHRLGAAGLIVLGIADNSIVPLTGSMDVLTIWLAAHHPHTWPFYALMATAGATIGGYITYSLARHGGKQMLERKLSKRAAAKVYRRFERWGFGAVAVPAILPPPFPMVPFLLAAGGLQYSRKKFLAALVLGRGIRFTILAGLGAAYGSHIVRFFARYYRVALAVLIALAVAGAVGSLVGYYRNRAGKPPSKRATVARRKTA